jgi:pyruvate-formate lyase-activating enzyme
MKIFNKDKKQPTIEGLTDLPIEKLTDTEMGALAGGVIWRGGEPTPPRNPSRGRG